MGMQEDDQICPGILEHSLAFSRHYHAKYRYHVWAVRTGSFTVRPV
jgi:hypothetical protein